MVKHNLTVTLKVKGKPDTKVVFECPCPPGPMPSADLAKAFYYQIGDLTAESINSGLTGPNSVTIEASYAVDGGKPRVTTISIPDATDDNVAALGAALRAASGKFAAYKK